MSAPVIQQKMNANEVAKNLWVGGYPSDHEAVNKNFNALVLSAKELQEFPEHKFPKLHVIRAPLNDAKPTRDERALALKTALHVHELHKAGKKVLVTCAAGVNRSAMIAALAMVIGGVPAAKAIANIRARRKPVSKATPLFNQHFVKHIEEVDDHINSAVSSQTP